MKQMQLQEKYPVLVTEIAKNETTCHDVEDVVSYLKAMIAEHREVKFIAVFDHYAHTRSIGGEIDPAIKAAVDVVFCFGTALPSPQVLAVRPRSVGVADLGDRFAVSFMEAPSGAVNSAMQAWVKGLRNKI